MTIAIELGINTPQHADALERIRASGFRVLTDEKYINREPWIIGYVENYLLVRD